jgi:nitroimidazol reductase NimA-like FMN-containing flavoprotein (pyridoxamine 5'-phosphate oxidase superfamily)
MTTGPSARRLTTAECWGLMEVEEVGRLAVTRRDGAPDIFPVNYVVHEGAVYVRSAPDAKVVSLDARPAAAFEIDGRDEDGVWSVVVRGHAARTVDAVEIERSGITRVVTASPRYKAHVLKLSVDTITGRRFADRTESPAQPSSRPPAAAPPAPPPARPRAERPEPIASHRPRPDGLPS